MPEYDADLNIMFSSDGDSIEQARFQGLTMSLKAAGDGTELILHHLTAGRDWAMGPEDGWTALECICVVRGHLTWKSDTGIRHALPGDVISAHPVTQYIVFTALEDTDFLYVVSQPVFHLYSEHLQELSKMAVSIAERDGYTSDHCDRIKSWAVKVGRALNLGQLQLGNLNLAAFFHDVGKTRVPEGILLKPAALTEDEWKQMKEHALHGRQLLLDSKLPSLREPAEIVAQHHERQDGEGYPYGLKGNEICIEAAIISVVDAFDAMTSDRPYHKGINHREAIEELRRCAGTQFHPAVVEAFVQVAMEEGQ